MTSNYDPFDAALVDEPSRFAGQVKMTAWQCILETGVGRIPYDPQIHQGKRTSVCIEMTVEPLDPTRKLIERDALNWTPRFKQVIRPSIEALAEKIADIKGLTLGQFNPLREISGLWVVGEFVLCPDNKEGETYTTLKFLDVFANEADCQDAFREAQAEAAPESSPEPQQDDQRKSMAAFLPPLWAQSGQDVAKFQELLESNPMFSVFTMESPEIKAVIGG